MHFFNTFVKLVTNSADPEQTAPGSILFAQPFLCKTVGPSCSKLTIFLVTVALNFQTICKKVTIFF